MRAVGVGTISVEILQSYTRGSRAPRLAKVRPPIHALFSIHNHTARTDLPLRMLAGRYKFLLGIFAAYNPPPSTVWEMHVTSLPQCQATAYYLHLFFPKRIHYTGKIIPTPTTATRPTTTLTTTTTTTTTSTGVQPGKHNPCFVSSRPCVTRVIISERVRCKSSYQHVRMFSCNIRVGLRAYLPSQFY